MITSALAATPADVVVSTAEPTAAEVRAAVGRAAPRSAEWHRGRPGGAGGRARRGRRRRGRGGRGIDHLVVREVGKPVGEARGEVARAVAILRYYAQQAFDPIGRRTVRAGDGAHASPPAVRAAWPG